MITIGFNDLCDLIREVSERVATDVVDEVVKERESVLLTCMSSGVRVEVYVAVRTMNGRTMIHKTRTQDVPEYMFDPVKVK